MSDSNGCAALQGKLLDVELDFKGEPVGGHITHCEYSRARATAGNDPQGLFPMVHSSVFRKRPLKRNLCCQVFLEW